MATNKNQHYVPRCYLRSFCSDENGKSLVLFNIDRMRLVVNAPAKSQCSGDNFYGQDPALEGEIRYFEDRFGPIRSAIATQGYSFTEEHRCFLKRFWLLQNMRAVQAAETYAKVIDGIGDMYQGGTITTELKQAVQHAMRIFLESKSQVDDLACCLVRNNTATPFITSDEPAALANLLFAQRRAPDRSSFGRGSSGALLFLPISPSVAFIGYDRAAYNVTNERGWVNLRRESDAHAVNFHQFINARANIFISHASLGGYVSKSLREIVAQRPLARMRMRYFTESNANSGVVTVAEVSLAQLQDGQNVYTAFQPVYVHPPTWPSFIRMKRPAVVFGNGSIAGWVREAHVPPEPRFQVRRLEV